MNAGEFKVVFVVFLFAAVLIAAFAGVIEPGTRHYHGSPTRGTRYYHDSPIREAARPAPNWFDSYTPSRARRISSRRGRR
jgi:hypothetical protein